MSNCKLVIICATQRCGSTMIVDDFRSTGVLGYPEEYFIPWTSRKLDQPINNYNKILENSKTANGVSSIKIMADQLESIENQLVDVFDDQELENVLYPRCKKLFEGAKFITIDRIDIVAQAVSRYMAKATGKNHFVAPLSSYIPGNVTEDNSEYNKSVKINNNEINKHVINIAKEKSIWSKVLSSWNENIEEQLIYENCINERTYLERIVNKLHLGEYQIEPRNIKKIGNERNEEMIRDYSLNKTPSTTEVSEEMINEIRDVGFDIWDLNRKSSVRLLGLVKKMRPNSPGVIEKLKNVEYL
ncbi:conserved hypothetical protein [Vibrio coralliirubri]|uniref:Stf0 family sulfotransferase n=1 Tax=Vibrio coralliirubri TaxID=1516159 RepID=UPI00063690A3|nr:Stf0 family sulfotransferase [Vibrio coralliirubri]CDT39221.1 conserved hypothetical protein [Vibrio coralliirubri]